MSKEAKALYQHKNISGQQSLSLKGMTIIYFASTKQLQSR